MEVSEKIAVEHGLKKEEYKKICDLLKRVPNLTELGLFSAMWNEHCSYKSSKNYLKNLNTKGKRVIQGTVKEELPENFQTSEYVQKTGFVDLIVERKDLAEKIGTLLSILLKKNSVITSEENETSEDSQSITKVAS